MGWLAGSHPELVGEYRRLYGRGAYLPADYRDMLRERVTPLLLKHGLAPPRRPTPASTATVAAAPVQPTLF
jgi:hypothetical protein